MHNHFLLLDKYRKHERTIRDLLASITTSLDSMALLKSEQQQIATIHDLSRSYPFIELMYSLDQHGIQQFETALSKGVTAAKKRHFSKGADRSHRPYFLEAQNSSNSTVVTAPYLSSATHTLSLSSVQHLVDEEGNDQGYLVINFNLPKLVAYLLGNVRQNALHPFFQSIYALIGASLIGVAIWLLGASFYSFLNVFDEQRSAPDISFGIVVMLTLSLAIFDLGKTILEEEVLSSKDINHYQSSRRTIMRFMSAIIIAVTIEALLLMFKSVLSANVQNIQFGVWMLLSGVGLLAGLGAYLRLSREDG
ncbi:PDC sensor domain-containing protein [Marinomonas communis]|uniref:hypothetical protein n=1 Tax=Marinomonas communis TaxID=28254 RepID=UPI001D18643F|nr:hypothetical protein [Marinomonas communis]MCC4273808.1 hypothetical protein [Marinomonas communis]